MTFEQYINQIIRNLVCRFLGHKYTLKRMKGKQCARCGKYKSNYIIEDITLTTYVKEK